MLTKFFPWVLVRREYLEGLKSDSVENKRSYAFEQIRNYQLQEQIAVLTKQSELLKADNSRLVVALMKPVTDGLKEMGEGAVDD